MLIPRNWKGTSPKARKILAPTAYFNKKLPEFATPKATDNNIKIP